VDISPFLPKMSTSSTTSSPSSLKSSNGHGARIGLCIFATLYTFFFVGALFGWGPMQRMLESAGAFDYQCTDDNQDQDEYFKHCAKQSNTIIQINFVATATNTLTPFMGQAIDRWGAPAVATYFMSPCAILGSGVVAYTAFRSYNAGTDLLYFVGFSLLGLATFSGSLLNVQVGLYFGGTLQVRVIMFLNALFDAGSVTYLLLWYILESYEEVSFATICLSYFFLALFCYIGAIFFWNTATPLEFLADEVVSLSIDNNEQTPLLEIVPGQQQQQHQENEDGPTGSSYETSMNVHLMHKRQQVRESLREFQAAHMENSEEIRSTLLSYRSSFAGEGRGLTTEVGSTLEINDKDTDNKPDTDYILIADRSPKDQILSLPYIMLTLFFSINMVSCNWTLATAADFLASLGDDDGTYLRLFTIFQPASILALPLVDATVHKFGFGTAFQCVNALTFIYILIKLTSDNLNMQVVTFAMVAVIRCYLYAVTFSFLPRLLSADAVGKGTGLLYMVGGVASFVNIPLNNMVLKTGFFPPNLLYCILTIPTTLMALVVQMTIRKEEKAIKAKQVSLV
jgi:hypothetical protein